MTKHQKLLLRQSEVKTSLGNLLDLDVEKREADYETEVKKVSAELRSMETEIQAALLLDGPTQTHTEPTGEGRELRKLLSTASVGRMLSGIMGESDGDGAEREVRQALNMGPDFIPLAMLEKRAAVAVTGDEGNQTAPLDSTGVPWQRSRFLWC